MEMFLDVPLALGLLDVPGKERLLAKPTQFGQSTLYANVDRPWGLVAMDQAAQRSGSVTVQVSCPFFASSTSRSIPKVSVAGTRQE